MSENAENKSNAGQWIIALAMVLVLYVLSFGPVYALSGKYHLSGAGFKTLKTIYGPMFWGGVDLLGLADLVGLYCEWWCKILDVPLYKF